MEHDRLGSVLKTVQVICIVIGVVLSIQGFNQTRDKETRARVIEAENRKIEAAKPFLELRQRFYLDALQQAAILSNPETHSKIELDAARKRFRELYVAVLSMVEASDVEGKMVEFAGQVDPGLVAMTNAQNKAYNLAHAFRNSLINSWKVDEKVVDNPHN